MTNKKSFVPKMICNTIQIPWFQFPISEDWFQSYTSSCIVFPSWLVWGQKSSALCMLLCPNSPKFSLNQRDGQQTVRTYCPNIYAVIKGDFDISSSPLGQHHRKESRQSNMILSFYRLEK